ncbi:glycoside hydrolase family 65 protein [Alkaliphilus peptidifermentans]|uniref:Alpha,alpha-trehalose phosphorylase n=1 Tax=Alkaliphilus peptidifermentans DSM 18978 TaxID=1120976 RepID=A0A1G5JPL8_9FIRM|nr:glycosyl hydrolase family 65 protein [Alkaliphilus peptidifermentans]SCY89658.1 alpha,alpha-trehalose phosphorylase [Alkaliphilus peptidifermentans DSM 18978]
MRSFHKNKKAIYSYDEWNIIEDEFKIENNYRNETIFSLGNGYIGFRGNIEEGFAKKTEGCKGSYINGFYESEKIIYGEYQYAFPLWGQTMLNIMDTQSLEIYVDGEKFTMDNGVVLDYCRTLHMKEGKLTRYLIWKSPKGRNIEIYMEKFISLHNSHLSGFRLKLTPLNFTGKVKIVSSINGNVTNKNLRDKALITLDKGVDKNILYMMQQTKTTKFQIACGILHEIFINNKSADLQASYSIEEESVTASWEIDAEENSTILVDKFICYDTNRKHEKKDNILKNVKSDLYEACKKGYNKLLNQHERYMKNFWDNTDIIINGDEALQQGIRFNMLQLLQSTGRDGYTNIAAKGLTGEGYEGHYFWDTETYILPFFLYNNPDIAKALVMYRYYTLDSARQRAKELDHPGALYPWRTIGGEETSAYFEASTAQYHINADVVYAIKKYYEATDDKELLLNYGVEIVWETARLWADRGGFIPLRGNKFCIHEVTGPDEYKAGVDNNCYTNYMAQMHLYYAVELDDFMKKEDLEKYESLRKRLELKDEEVQLWRRAAENMYLPYNEELGINPQDDTFIYKEPYDIESIPVERLPLVFNWHPLNIWRYQVCKQADVLLLMLLQSEKFSIELKKANFDYYEPKTTHDSSLSACVFSVIASEIGYKEFAYNYFMQTARMDLDDYNNNVNKGVHTASMAGAWMCIVNGFSGLRIYDNKLHFKPYLPDKWKSYEFKITFKNSKLRIQISKDKVVYRLMKGKDISFYHFDKEVVILGENNQQSFFE